MSVLSVQLPALHTDTHTQDGLFKSQDHRLKKIKKKEKGLCFRCHVLYIHVADRIGFFLKKDLFNTRTIARIVNCCEPTLLEVKLLYIKLTGTWL